MKRSLIVLAALALAAGPARADDAADRRAAQALLDEGLALYDQGDYGAALDLFERGYQMYPSATLLMNMGTTYVQLGRTVDAANAYQGFLDDPTSTGPRASEIRSSLAILDTTLGRLSVAADAPVELQVGDGAWLPARREHLVRVAPGTYVVRARRDGRTTDLTGRIGVGEEQTLVPTFAAPATAPIDEAVAAPPRPIALDAPEPAPSPRRRRTLALITGGAGVVVLGAGIALALRSTSRYDESRALCERPGGCGADRDRAVALSDRAGTDRLLAIGAAIVGVAAITTGTVLWIKAPRRRGDSSAALTFIAAPRELGLAAAGSF